MKKLRAFAALPLLTAACCAPTPEPTPTPPIVVQPPAPVTPPPQPPRPTTVQQSAYENWLDAPQTAGDWTYRDGTGLSFATFGAAGQPAVFGVECQKRSRTIRLVRGTSQQGPVPMRFRTETAERLLTANSQDDGRPMLMATLPASDRLLDAIALSRGRFAVETGGLETLYLPAWSEVTRVIEDCR